ncbi:MAG TPA: hypothetical protein ENJ95_13740 [Bacteroidetes bacterium]|nr:hypothetical protein [Bacteroidota bacterium]
MNIQEVADLPSMCSEMTMLHGQMERPFLYVANKEAGLKIYDISSLNPSALMKTIPVSELEGLHVMNLHQDGQYLYLALGNFFWKCTSCRDGHCWCGRPK